jgi:hypothetical protein
MLEDFYRTGKIHRLRPGSRIPEASMLTTRPPKPSRQYVNKKIWYLLKRQYVLKAVRTKLISTLFVYNTVVATVITNYWCPSNDCSFFLQKASRCSYITVTVMYLHRQAQHTVV